MAAGAAVCIQCEHAEEIGGFRSDIKNLKDWQEKQHGALLRIDQKTEKVDAKVDALKWGLHCSV